MKPKDIKAAFWLICPLINEGKENEEIANMTGIHISFINAVRLAITIKA